MRDGSTRRPQGQRGVGPDISGRMPNPYGSTTSGRVPDSLEEDSAGTAKSPYRRYDPYNPGTSARMPTLGSATLYGASSAGAGRQSELWTSARLQAAVAHKHRLGITIFHDGNPGHLWRGEIASRFAEVLVNVGAVIWLAALLQSAMAIALAFVALGLPFLLVGPFGAWLENASRPGIALKWLNNARFVLVLALIGLFFHFIAPAMYAVLFLLSLCGRLHDAAHTAAMRMCLAPGEPEHVANDIFVGGALAAVLGPLIAGLLYVLIGERIIAVDILAAGAFLVGGNSEGLLDTLPPGRRAFMLATPEALYENGEIPVLAHSPEEADLLDDEDWREESLPAWYQQGPTSPRQAFGEFFSGLGLVGASPVASLAVWTLSGLAIAGAVVATLAVFYITGDLGLPSFYLAPFIAAESAGLVLGSMAAPSETAKSWRSSLLWGLVGSGVACLALSGMPMLAIALALALLLGFTSAVALSAARRALYADFDPVEQRALSAADHGVAALAALGGAVLVGLLLGGTKSLAGMPGVLSSLPSLTVSEMLLLLGVGLIAGAVLVLVLANGRKGRPAATGGVAGASRVYSAVAMGDAVEDEWDSANLDAIEMEDEDGAWDESYYAAEDERSSTRYRRRPGDGGQARW